MKNRLALVLGCASLLVCGLGARLFLSNISTSALPQFVSTLPKSLQALGPELHLSGMEGLPKGFFHLESNAEQAKKLGWLCGYRVLNNMVKIERENDVSKISDAQYQESCQRLTDPNGPNLTSSFYDIAQDLKLQPTFYLDNRKEDIHIFFKEGVNIRAVIPVGQQITDEIRMKTYEKARNKKERKTFQKLQNYLKQNGPKCVHFVCHVSGQVPHAILISVVKTADNNYAGLVVDNMNEHQTNNGLQQIKEHAEHIWKNLFLTTYKEKNNDSASENLATDIYQGLDSLGKQLHFKEITKKLAPKNVYQFVSKAEVPKRNGWLCGFHALYNMLETEKAIGVSQIKDEQFERTCTKHASPSQRGDSMQLLSIVKDLNLQQAAYLSLEEHGMKLVDTSETQQEGQKWCENCKVYHAEKESIDTLLDHTREKLQQPGPQCAHFICHVRNFEEHCVLISAVKTKENKTALVIMDNMNKHEPSKTRTQIHAYAEYLYDKLCFA